MRQATCLKDEVLQDPPLYLQCNYAIVCITTTLKQHENTGNNDQLVKCKSRKATRRKLRAFNKAKRTSNPADWKRYRNIKAQTQRELRSAYRKYMNDVISTDLKENPKRFWAAIKSKKQESTGVSPLKNKGGFIHSDTTSKAEILNEQFQSVYTKENTSTMPDKGQSKYPSMKDIVINTKGVFKLL